MALLTHIKASLCSPSRLEVEAENVFYGHVFGDQLLTLSCWKLQRLQMYSNTNNRSSRHFPTYHPSAVQYIMHKGAIGAPSLEWTCF